MPEALRASGLHVERHDDHFGPHTLDTEWLREVGARKWVALTHNKAIRYNTIERDVCMRAGVPLFMLIGATTHAELAQNFVQTVGKVIRFLNDNEPPFIARIYRPPHEDLAQGKAGRVSMWLSHQDWLDGPGGA